MTQQKYESPSSNDIAHFRRKITRWGRKNFSNFPWRNTRNRWHALCAEILLQRTKAEQVLPVYRKLTQQCVRPSDYISRGPRDLFGSLGLLWRQDQFDRLVQLLSRIAIPSDKVDLKRLPGVGDYIASAYRSLHLKLRDVIIDSNVVRIYGRFFGFRTHGETRRKRCFINLADRITPPRAFRDYNYGLIDFTREICKPIPSCIRCPLASECKFTLASQKST